MIPQPLIEMLGCEETRLERRVPIDDEMNCQLRESRSAIKTETGRFETHDSNQKYKYMKGKYCDTDDA